MEFVEVRGKTVEIAVEAALVELGLTSEEEAEVEVIEAGKKGFLGVGGTDAVVRVRSKSKQGAKRRRRRRGKGDGQEGSPTGASGAPEPARQPNQSRPKPAGRPAKVPATTSDNAADADSEAESLPAQAEIVDGFLKGLVGAFGLEASVTVEISKDGVAAAIVGDQAETLVGDKGAVMQAVQEVTRTVVQRRFHHPARVRVDVAGYNERRRQALAIYAQRLAAQVVDEGGEIMLEPMNPADRKVVHDTIADIDGVTSYSEGEDPRRCVVIGKESE